MMPTPGAGARMTLLILLAVILQVSGLGQIRVLGGNVDLVALLVIGVAFFAGAVPGALCGFFAGFLLDAAIGGNLGASSLVLTAVGYGTGRYAEVRRPAHGLAPLAVTAAASACYVLAFAAVSFMLEVSAAVSAGVLREMAMTVLLNTALALPVFALVRRLLRPVLVVDPFERRRRARTRDAGPLGLRGLEV